MPLEAIRDLPRQCLARWRLFFVFCLFKEMTRFQESHPTYLNTTTGAIFCCPGPAVLHIVPCQRHCLDRSDATLRLYPTMILQSQVRSISFIPEPRRELSLPYGRLSKLPGRKTRAAVPKRYERHKKLGWRLDSISFGCENSCVSCCGLVVVARHSDGQQMDRAISLGVLPLRKVAG